MKYFVAGNFWLFMALVAVLLSIYARPDLMPSHWGVNIGPWTFRPSYEAIPGLCALASFVFFAVGFVKGKMRS